MQRKFKVGDRIVKLKGESIIKIGEVVVFLDKVSTYDPNRPYVRRLSTGEETHVDIRTFELEDVYNSPLYQALK